MNNELKVLIVDDEVYIRNGLKMKVDWESLGMKIIGEASDGTEALFHIENESVDIVITDINMPIMDGLELIQKTKEINDGIIFIIISGYSEFEYARTAMKLGITDYLLKPIKQAEIQASLLSIKERILLTINEGNLYIQNGKKHREEVLVRLLSDQNKGATINEAMENLDLKINSENIILGLIKIELYKSFKQTNPTRSQFEDIEILFQNHLFQEHSGEIIKCVWPEHEFILLIDSSKHKIKDELLKNLTDALITLENKLGISATIGLSSGGTSNSNFISLYQESLFSLKERILRGTGKVINNVQFPDQLEKLDFTAEKKRLIHLMEERKWDYIKENIYASFNQLISKGSPVTHNHLYELFIELYFTIKNFASGKIGTTNQNHSQYSSGENIVNIASGFTSIQQMIDWLYTYIETECKQIEDKYDASGKEIVKWVQNYINTFYSSEITLAKVSEKYHINPIYFSRIFKAHVGISFNSYLTKIRMEEAKNLMDTTSLLVQDISEVVGYDDPKYFSKVFKKYYGKSPSLYIETKEKFGKNSLNS
ncbi:response regulator [Bacillus sp. JJ1521]|uniref:response regulator n=1 Tax=Bacillus sp. JJ1521 TaxID=3122957 RepID=UPI002FFEC331